MGGAACDDPHHARTAATSGRSIGVCNLCEAICGLELTIEGRDVVGVRGNPDDPLSRGHVCPKGVAIADVYADPDRLRRPVRRVGEGTDARWQEIGWDEAFDLVADNLARVINEHGDDALGVYLGNPNAHSLGSMTHGTAMFKSFRTKNRYSATSVDQLPHQLVAHLVFGHQLFLPIPDIDRTSWFLVVGGNPMASNGSLMTVPDFPQRLRDLRARGGRMVVLDPRRTETAKVADEHHFVRPGTDAWVLLAMLHVLTAEASPDDLPTVASYVDGLDTVVELVAEFTPERAEAVSGLPAAEVRRLARELAAADSGVVYSRIGVSAGPWGTVCQWAVTCLNVLTGNLDRPGGAMFTTPAIDAVGTRADRPRPPRRLALAGARAAGDRRRAARGGAARGDRDARRGTGPGPAHRRRATRCCPRPTAPGSTARCAASTSWPRWTSTSTRPPGTPT